MGGDNLGLGMWTLVIFWEASGRGVGRGGYWVGQWDGAKHCIVESHFLHKYWGGIRGLRTVLRVCLLKTWNQFLHRHSHISYATVF